MSASQKTDTFEVTITYLEQAVPPVRRPVPKPPGKLSVLRAERPPLPFYRYLFDQIGGPWHWVSRRYLDDDALMKHVHDPDTHLYVLYRNGSPVGMGEIDHRRTTHPDGAAEIKFFGLIPEATGRGLGTWFFSHIVDLAWALRPPRVLIETCTADHPAALPLYQKAGFIPYSQSSGIIEWRG